ncbi:MAG: FAD-dependent oxidoreductase [Pseudomonadota bacterium]
MESFAQDLRHSPRTPMDAGHIDALRAIGERRVLKSGDYLARVGDRMDVFFFIENGRIDLVDPYTENPYLDHGLGPGQFAGEMAFLYGGSWTRGMRASEDTSVVAVARQDVLELMAQIPELSDKVIEVFNARRRRLLEDSDSNLTLIGTEADRNIRNIAAFAARNRIPVRILEADSEDAARAARVCGAEAGKPAVIFAPDRLIDPPTTREVAKLVGIDLEVDCSQIYDVLIVGGGPAGVAAAVYSGAEGLSALLIDEIAIGGQTGTSSRIENYLGFPTGISGADLLWRGQVQAMKFGACFAMPRRVTCVRRAEDSTFVATIDDSEIVRARSIVIATGVQYRKLPLERLEDFEGYGVYYAATESEARHCREKEVAVIGGGNSAGQAAMYLSRHAIHVYVLVRGSSLAASMSDYLASRLAADAKITVCFGEEVCALEGDRELSGIRTRRRDSGEERHIDVCGLFVMAGAVPKTNWLQGLVELDKNGFVRTGAEIGASSPFATSTPGVFAVGDVRSGSVKRVASSVGEGSVAVSKVWEYVSSVKHV